MFQRVPEGFSRLARQGTAGGIRDGAGNHDRQLFTALFEHFLHGKHSRFGVQGVEYGFNQNNVSAAVHQTFGGLNVLAHQLVKRDGAETGVVHIRRDGQRLTGWAKHPGNVARNAGFGFHFVSDFTGEGRSGTVKLGHQIFQLVIGLRHAGSVKAVGLDDVRTGHEILAVNSSDDVWLGNDEKVIVAFDFLRDVRKTLAAVIFLFQPVTLNQRTHTAIEHMNTLRQILSEAGNTLLSGVG